ncbi:MAG TPA: hypothetical protein VES73_16125 [Lamprocystis sp. (in: g-proteobacteria)]|nr:hypothetical protein [Lamprocystis sp. (in: g-proteobacteria)]
MKLPNADSAIIERKKVVEYLLALDHSSGRSKARFFTGVGFNARRWQVLADALRKHAQDSTVTGTETSAYGQKYVVEGPLGCPGGRQHLIRSVWFITNGQIAPRLVTAYPAGATP